MHKHTGYLVMKHYVYFIQAGMHGPIKIGVARNLDGRLNQLQTGNHQKLKLIDRIECASQMNAYSLESDLHKKYRKHRIRGEWFEASAFNVKELKEIEKIAINASENQNKFDLYLKKTDEKIKERKGSLIECISCREKIRIATLISGKKRTYDMRGNRHKCKF